MGLIAEVSVEDLPIAPTLIWGGTPLFDAGDGIKLVDYCKNNGIAVLGIEGFKIKGGKRIPDMNCIVDFSASLNEMDFAVKSVGMSRLIVEGMSGSGVFMEFVLVRV
ncbi:hypothetical protein P0Y43_20135 [Pseudomonas entomophila]|uniref:hypothetical protein n=1 Tax=Pseudomonas entomophila TaxID=312306 RepID=UPI0023D87974|nr:hypothetical protein [Pseudomonas entomophila]MDF0733005.1 hypothetical protein [Pseudomonas entomophila]